MFNAHIIPLHTQGIGLQSHDLTKIRLGYDLMIGNGIGSTDFSDNDKYKSVTAVLHIKPADGMRIGVSLYLDRISAGVMTLDGTNNLSEDVDQKLYSGTLSYFHNRFELLAEGTLAYNQTDSLGGKQSIAWYAYGGVKFLKRFTIYGRFDQLKFEDGEMYFMDDDQTSIIGGVRFQINYLAVVKAEYQLDHTAMKGDSNFFNLEIAVGF